MSMYYIRSNFLLHQKPKKQKNTTFDWNPCLLFFFLCILVVCFFGVLVFGQILVFHISYI